MFYECTKCKRRWEYPLAECPYCFAALNKLAAKTARVSGAVKVAIQTLLHPNVPYYVLVLEDEMGNMWGYKSEKEYKVGDEFKLEENDHPAAVAIWRVKADVRAAMEKVFDLAGGINVGRGSKVVILPTLAAPSHSYFRDNTSPEFLTALIDLLLSRGVNIADITVASQSFDEMPIAAAAQKSGLVEVWQKYGIMPADLASTEFVKSDRFEISKTVLEADLVINLVMEKMGQAAATANLFKVLKKENYLGQKYLSSDAEIAAALEPILTKIMVVGEAENVQRSNKLTTFIGLILAGKSSRNVDRMFNEATKSFKMPETIKEIDIVDIPIAGRTIKEVQYQAEIF